MSDLRFLIVNNHLPHSVAEKGKLDARVSFPVYQDSEERRVWQLMRGGKDDVFIYDRCGRLAYFIPFPLSIMNTEDALVPTAILATYFQSPCGTTCTPSDEDDTVQAHNTTDLPYFTTYPPSLDEEVSNSTLPDFQEDYLSSLEDEDNDTDVGHPLGARNDLSFVFDNITASDNGTLVEAQVVEANSTRSNDIPMVSTSFSNETEGENETLSSTATTITAQVTPRKKSSRCAEADMSVCRTWSKRKLLRAPTCCNNGVHTTALADSCRNYGKKRCKKIRTVLKCCLKTSYSEDKLQPDDVKVNSTVDDVRVNSTVDDLRVNSTVDDIRVNNTVFKAEAHASPDDVINIEVTTVVDYVVCCKEDRGGERTCRVSLEGTCEADEIVSSESPSLLTN